MKDISQYIRKHCISQRDEWREESDPPSCTCVAGVVTSMSFQDHQDRSHISVLSNPRFSFSILLGNSALSARCSDQIYEVIRKAITARGQVIIQALLRMTPCAPPQQQMTITSLISRSAKIRAAWNFRQFHYPA
ncbi:hypothetical protein PTI98_008116 [Pleurotus ostreatus]|nr:hypothetical protein PTI98_008116 [Pleurotus ostreatus]